MARVRKWDFFGSFRTMWKNGAFEKCFQEGKSHVSRVDKGFEFQSPFNLLVLCEEPSLTEYLNFRSMVFELRKRRADEKPKSSISGSSQLMIHYSIVLKNDSESQWWKKMYMTFWQAKSTLLATLTFSLVYFLNGRKPDKGNRKLALDIREQSQHQWVWTTAENFIIGNLGRCLLPPPRQATISHVLLHFTEKR